MSDTDTIFSNLNQNERIAIYTSAAALSLILFAGIIVCVIVCHVSKKRRRTGKNVNRRHQNILIGSQSPSITGTEYSEPDEDAMEKTGPFDGEIDDKLAQIQSISEIVDKRQSRIDFILRGIPRPKLKRSGRDVLKDNHTKQPKAELFTGPEIFPERLHREPHLHGDETRQDDQNGDNRLINNQVQQHSPLVRKSTRHMREADTKETTNWVVYSNNGDINQEQGFDANEVNGYRKSWGKAQTPNMEGNIDIYDHNRETHDHDREDQHDPTDHNETQIKDASPQTEVNQKEKPFQRKYPYTRKVPYRYGELSNDAEDEAFKPVKDNSDPFDVADKEPEQVVVLRRPKPSYGHQATDNGGPHNPINEDDHKMSAFIQYEKDPWPKRQREPSMKVKGDEYRDATAQNDGNDQFQGFESHTTNKELPKGMNSNMHGNVPQMVFDDGGAYDLAGSMNIGAKQFQDAHQEERIKRSPTRPKTAPKPGPKHPQSPKRIATNTPDRQGNSSQQSPEHSPERRAATNQYHSPTPDRNRQNTANQQRPDQNSVFHDEQIPRQHPVLARDNYHVHGAKPMSGEYTRYIPRDQDATPNKDNRPARRDFSPAEQQPFPQDNLGSGPKTTRPVTNVMSDTYQNSRNDQPYQDVVVQPGRYLGSPEQVRRPKWGGQEHIYDKRIMRQSAMDNTFGDHTGPSKRAYEYDNIGHIYDRKIKRQSSFQQSFNQEVPAHQPGPYKGNSRDQDHVYHVQLQPFESPYGPKYAHQILPQPEEHQYYDYHRRPQGHDANIYDLEIKRQSGMNPNARNPAQPRFGVPTLIPNAHY